MVDLAQNILPYIVLVSHVVLVITFFALVSKDSWGRKIARMVGKWAITLGFLVSFAAALGSLFYSVVVGFEPCVLCWWQRVLLFPLVPIFAIALWKKDNQVFRYVAPLALGGAIIAAYQSYVYLGGGSFLPCTAVGGACSKIYVMAFGYITIPMMSLTISLYILLFAWAHRIYVKDTNSNA
jgi:disulfide bond formation protein DsbB